MKWANLEQRVLQRSQTCLFCERHTYRIYLWLRFYLTSNWWENRSAPSSYKDNSSRGKLRSTQWLIDVSFCFCSWFNYFWFCYKIRVFALLEQYLNVGKFIKYKEIKTYFQEFVSLFIISALSNTTLFYKDYRRPYVNKKKDFVVKILFFLGCDSVGIFCDSAGIISNILAFWYNWIYDNVLNCFAKLSLCSCFVVVTHQ